MRRRDLIAVLSGAAVVLRSSDARAQSRHVVGFLGMQPGGSRVEAERKALAAGLAEGGFLERDTVTIEYRFAEGENERFAALAKELVERKVEVIVTSGNADAALAAKAASATIPVVFATGADPVAVGLVRNLNRPEANVTGVTLLGVQLVPKSIELMNELLPSPAPIGVMINPRLAVDTRTIYETAAKRLDRNLIFASPSREAEFEPALVSLGQQRVVGVAINIDALFGSYTEQFASLMLKHRMPAIMGESRFTVAGGLMSYSAPIEDAYRQIGVYVAKILKGAHPQDLPVVEATRIELVLNLKTAKVLGITFPLTLLGRADRVIE